MTYFADGTSRISQGVNWYSVTATEVYDHSNTITELRKAYPDTRFLQGVWDESGAYYRNVTEALESSAP